jgi:hypothetical protein
MSLQEVIPFLYVLALYPPAGTFLAVGGWMLGPMDDTRELGVVQIFTGVWQTISIILLFLAGDGFGAATVLPLAFAWYGLGITSILGFTHFKPIVNSTFIILIIFYVIEAIYLIMRRQLLLPLMLLSYAIVVTMAALWVYKGILRKATAYVFIFEGIVTILIPAIMLMYGIPWP